MLKIYSNTKDHSNNYKMILYATKIEALFLKLQQKHCFLMLTQRSKQTQFDRTY